MEMSWRRRAGAGLLRCRKARVHDGSARTRILPFLAFRASEDSQSSRTAALGADECNGKSGDG
jgi:hypothetical protein